MRQSRSWARQEYNNHCRWMRRGWSFDQLVYLYPDQLEVIKAADYSYQAYGYEDNGWLSDERRKRFQAIKWRILTQTEDIPF